jgi:hypothetical protein
MLITFKDLFVSHCLACFGVNINLSEDAKWKMLQVLTKIGNWKVDIAISCTGKKNRQTNSLLSYQQRARESCENINHFVLQIIFVKQPFTLTRTSYLGSKYVDQKIYSFMRRLWVQNPPQDMGLYIFHTSCNRPPDMEVLSWATCICRKVYDNN